MSQVSQAIVEPAKSLQVAVVDIINAGKDVFDSCRGLADVCLGNEQVSLLELDTIRLDSTKLTAVQAKVSSTVSRFNTYRQLAFTCRTLYNLTEDLYDDNRLAPALKDWQGEYMTPIIFKKRVQRKRSRKQGQANVYFNVRPRPVQVQDEAEEDEVFSIPVLYTRTSNPMLVAQSSLEVIQLPATFCLV